MPIAPHSTIDPLAAFMAGAFVAGTQRPCPLVATRFDVIVDAGLAVVAMTRAFRNAEEQSIEATITFPVPVQAALFALEVRLGERVLKARAQRKAAARERYEQALDAGKAAVLHEEVLRGVHMLSVGHIAPGAQVEVRVTFAMTLTNVDGRARLRIPLTVGDIYGRSGLSDSDDLIHGGPQQSGTLTVECRDGTATLLGGALQDGSAEIAFNAPIEIDVAGWTPRDLGGRAADGRAVALRIAPYAGSDSALDVAMLVDHSGSMGERCSTLQGNLTKHAAALAALAALDRQIGAADAVDLWEFDDDLTPIGSTRAARLRDLVQQLDGPRGGTAIGGALEGVLSRSQARDVLLVTDGKSHALDVMALARRGHRISAVLVGADSLEAYVGHLAALTGGEIFVAAGPDLSAMVDAATRSLRSQWLPARLAEGELRERRAGMELTAIWRAGDAGEAVEQTIEARAVAALSASLLLPTLSEEEAATLAEAEGLVTHLTSLILVDEAAAAQPGIPATRKIALPTPDTAFDSPAAQRRITGMRPLGAAKARAFVPGALEAEQRKRAEEIRPEALERRKMAEQEAARRSYAKLAHTPAPAPETPLEQKPKAKSRTKFKMETRRAKRSLSQWYKDLLGQTPAAGLDIEALSARIDWEAAPQRLMAGDLSGLAADIARAIRDLAGEPIVREAARRFGSAPMLLAIGLLARIAAPRSRSAERIARTILGDRSTDDIEAQLTHHMRATEPIS